MLSLLENLLKAASQVPLHPLPNELYGFNIDTKPRNARLSRSGFAHPFVGLKLVRVRSRPARTQGSHRMKLKTAQSFSNYTLLAHIKVQKINTFTPADCSLLFETILVIYIRLHLSVDGEHKKNILPGITYRLSSLSVRYMIEIVPGFEISSLETLRI